MKKNLSVLILLFLILNNSVFSQIQFTGKPDATNGLDIYAENIGSSTVSGILGNGCIVVSIIVPNSYGSTASTATLTASPSISGLAFAPVSATGSQFTQNGVTLNSISYDIFSFLPTTAYSSSVSFAPGVEVLIGTVNFSGFSNNQIGTVGLDFLSEYGPSGFDQAYIAPGGTDATDYANPFYSDIPSDPNLHNANSGDVNNPATSYLIVSSVPVPVKFTGFSVAKQNDNAVLNWSAVNEDAVATNYNVERSIDGVNFSTITEVPKGSNASANSYSYTDPNISALNAPVIYYRVEQVDNRGNAVYTDIKTVTLNSGLTINAYPNPVTDVVNVVVTLEAPATVTLSLFDASGKQVTSQQLLQGIAGANTTSLNLSGLASGTYLLKVTTGTSVSTISLIKQ